MASFTDCGRPLDASEMDLLRALVSKALGASPDVIIGADVHVHLDRTGRFIFLLVGAVPVNALPPWHPALIDPVGQHKWIEPTL
jgi:hypothetical protein